MTQERLPRTSWERTALRLLAWPATVAFAGLAAFVLALGLVTGLSAAVAAGVAVHRWRTDDDDRVFTGTFRAWRATWRRTLPLSVVATVVSVVLGTNWFFLGSRTGPVAVALVGATVPVAAVWVLLLVHLPAAVALAPDASRAQWLRTTVWLGFASLPRSLGVLVVVATSCALCATVPTLVPVLGFGIPVLTGVLSAERAVRRAER